MVENANEADLEVAEWLMVLAKGNQQDQFHISADSMTATTSKTTIKAKDPPSSWRMSKKDDEVQIRPMKRSKLSLTNSTEQVDPKKPIGSIPKNNSDFKKRNGDSASPDTLEFDEMSDPDEPSGKSNSNKQSGRPQVQEFEALVFSPDVVSSLLTTETIITDEDATHLKANANASYVHYLSTVIPRLKDEQPDEMRVEDFFDKLIKTKVFCPFLQKKLYLVTQEFNHVESIQRKQIMRTNRNLTKRDDEFYNLHFKAALQLMESKGLKTLIEVAYWSIVILSVKQFAAEGFTLFDEVFFEADYSKHIISLGLQAKDYAVIVRYSNHMRAANKVLPTYYKQKFRHHCGELLEMSGMRRTLGGAPSKVTAMMMIVSKREGVLNR